MLPVHHSSLLISLPSLGLITVLALLCLSSLTTASPVQSTDNVLLAKRTPIPGSVNSTPGPLLVANEPPDGPNPPVNPPANPPANQPANPPTSPVAIPGAPRMPTIQLASHFDSALDIRPIPVCEGQAPTDRSLYPSNAIADRWIGRSLEDLCRERDPGPNCQCIVNERNLQVQLQCILVGRFFPSLDQDWHSSGVMQVCRSKCTCPHIPVELVPPGSPRTPLGPRPPSLGRRPSRDMALAMDTVV